MIAQQVKHVPPFVMADQEGGEYNVFPDLPPAHVAADVGSVEAAVREADETGATLKPLGINGRAGARDRRRALRWPGRGAEGLLR